MHDLRNAGPVDWLEFHDPDTDRPIAVNLTFLASNWKCRYGIGCPGCLTAKDRHTYPDIGGCCSHGFFLSEEEEKSGEIDKRVKKLTKEDWDDELRAVFKKKGDWKTKQGKSLIVDGGCIFANRADGSVGSTGKTGCAFLHMGNRVNGGKNKIGENSKEHEQFMPQVCWMLPLYTYYDNNGGQVLTAWTNDMWTGGEPRDADGTSNTSHLWWCVDDPESYINDRPVYVVMEREIRSLIGDRAYEIVVEVMLQRFVKANAVTPMPASPEGRQLLKVLGMPQPPYETIATQIGDLPPKRPMP